MWVKLLIKLLILYINLNILYINIIFFLKYTCMCVYLYIHKIIIHSAPTYIMETKFFILDAINRYICIVGKTYHAYRNIKK